MAGSDQDYWTSLPIRSSAEPVDDVNPGIIIRNLGSPNGAPDPASGSAWLRQLLSVPNAPRYCYLLVDGTLRAEVAGHFDLDVLPIEAVSLFDGSAAEIIGDAAPWLVRLTLPTSDEETDTPFCRDFFKRHWPAGFSILILTSASLEAVRAHLRRFIRLPLIEDDRVLTFRFWDPRVLHPFLTQLTGDRPRARRLGITNDGVGLSYLLPAGTDDFPVLVSPGPGLAAEPIRPMRLSYADFDLIARAKVRVRRDRMVVRLQTDFPNELADFSTARLEQTIEAALRHYAAYGINSHAHLHMMAAWSVFYGVGFERDDPSGELEAILRSDASEKDRFKAFRARFDSFDMSPEEVA